MNKNFKNKNLKGKRKQANTNAGITLIALILTIIVLLILAVVAIQAVQGDGILAHARNARDKWEEATANEEAMLGNLTNYIASQSDGTTYEIIDVELQKGNYVNYHYKDDSGADAIIRCKFVGSISGIEWNGVSTLPFDRKLALFPLSTLGDLSIWPETGNSSIREEDSKWSSALGAEVSSARPIY